MDHLPLYNNDTQLLGTVATDEIANVHYPRSKVGFGADGAYGDVSAANPLPVSAVQSGVWNVGAVSSVTGVVHVDDNGGSLTVDNAGTFAVQVSAALPAGSNVIGGVTQSGAWSVTIGGNVTAVQATATNLRTAAEQYIGGVAVSAANPVPVADAGGSLTVDGTVAVSGTVTVDSELPAAAALGDGITNPTTPIVGAALAGFNGTTWDRLRGDVANGLDVDVTRVQGTVAVTQSGSWSVGLSAGTQSVGKVVPEASAGGTGTTAFRQASLSNTSQEVKASAGRLYGLHCFNPNTSESYVQLYDHASPTVGTTTPTRTYAVPGRGWLTLDLTVPQSYATAIRIAATTTAGGGTAPASGLLVDVEYL